jgi:hypothetical protein
MKPLRKITILFLALTFCFTVGLKNNDPVSAYTATPTAVPAGGCDVLLLSCMDYRLTYDTGKYMQQTRGLKGNYDHIILAGAGLGANNTMFPKWSDTFWEHLKVAIDLHHIHKVMILDHRDCGAYKVILNEGSEDRGRETKVHAEQLTKLKGLIMAKYPKLEVELLLMSLDGSVEPVGAIGMAMPKND